MLLDVSKALVAPGNEIAFEGSIPLPDAAVLDEAIAFPEPVYISGTYVSLGDVIVLRGNIAFTAAAGCARCLRPAQHGFEAAFEAQFSLVADPEDPDLYVYEGAFINPAQVAADTALMALPLQWLCGRGCKGLCPTCGTDRNSFPCTCQSGGKLASLSALKQLMVQDESEV